MAYIEGPGLPIKSGSSPSGVRVTYIGNSGFSVAIGGRHILIDAIFAGFAGDYQLPRNVRQALVEGHSPFDDVDVILITHHHADHFDAPMVRRFMDKNPKTRLVSTAQVTAQLGDLGDRIITLAAVKGKPDQMNVEGIQVKALYLPHSSPVAAGKVEDINFGYFVEVDGFRFFHTGDCVPRLIDMTVPPCPGKSIDAAFVGHFYFKDDPVNTKFIKEWIHAKYLFAAHYAYSGNVDRNKIKSLFPDVILFEEELQSWDMPLGK